MSRTMSQPIYNNFEKDCLVADSQSRRCCSHCHPYANSIQSRPFSLMWSHLSRTIHWSIVRHYLCVEYTLKHLIPIEYGTTEASQWLGKKSRAISESEIRLWGVICCLRPLNSEALFLNYFQWTKPPMGGTQQ